jgi:hypothetical protein
MNVRTISIINWFKGGSQFHVSQVGKATKSMLQKTPIVTGNAVSISCVSFDGSGKKNNSPHSDQTMQLLQIPKSTSPHA